MANKNYNKQVTPKGYKMGGRVKKMGGGMMKRPMYKDGGLKPVDKSKNPGLAKLPTKVRNKMGFMKDGGRVKKMGGGMMKRPMYKDGTKPISKDILKRNKESKKIFKKANSKK